MNPRYWGIRDAQEMEQQTVRSAATSEASELQRRLEEQAASLKQQVSEHREAAGMTGR